jgi:putative MATE family efflux protein
LCLFGTTRMNSLIDSPGTLRPMLRLALPVLAEQFLATLVVYSDTALAGQFLGEAPLAAMALLCYPMWLISGLFAFIAIGSLAMTARFVGAGEGDMAQQVANQSLMAGTILSVAVLAALWLSAGPLVALMNAPADAAPLATSFLRIVAFVMPAVMLTQIGPACLRGAGDTVSGMVALGVVNVVNIAVSWLLICPALLAWRQALGIPEFGFTGLAIGTTTGYVCGGLILLIWLARGRAGLKLQWRLLRPRRDLIRRILRIGLPGGSDILAIVLCQMWFVSMIFDLGQTFAAAHGVGVRIESLAYMPGSAFQVAAATLAGQFLGARDPHRASRSVWMACLVAEVVMVAAGLVFFFGGQPLVRIFVSEADRDVIVIAAELLKIVAFALPPFALAMVLSGALRGAGDTRWPFIFSLIGLLGVRIPLAYLLTHYWHFGVHGAWYAMAADLTIRCILVSLRFHHGGWKLVTV